MRDRWQKIKKMPQSESKMKTPPSTTTKRFHFNTIVNQIIKLFSPSNQTQPEPQQPNKCFDLPSISVTSPEGQTTIVEE